MGGVVKAVRKNIVPIAITAAVVATAGAAAPAAATWGTAGGLGSIGTVGVTSGFGLSAIGSTIASNMTFGNALSAGGLLMQGAGLATQTAGNIQSQKYINQQTTYQQEQVEAANKSDEARNRYNMLQQKRSRLAVIRQARISQGRITAGMGGVLGAGGTSGYIGAVGSLGTQASANIGNINVADTTGQAISGFNTEAANYGSKAATAGSKGTAWKDTAKLGETIFDTAEKLFT
jgi:hypothetical protein